MTRRSAAPFYQLSEGAVTGSRWGYELNGVAFGALEALLPDWDYEADLRLDRCLRVDWARAATDLELQQGFDLELLVEVGSGRGSLPRETVSTLHLPLTHGCGERDLVVSVPSRALSHQIIIRSSILLVSTVDALGMLAPRETGSRLWSDRVTARLEGDAPRFPMEVVEFSRHFAGRPQRHSPWFVNWSPAGANRDFRGAVRLYLNAEHPEIIERVQAQDTLLLQAIMSDVVSQVCEGLLRDTEHGSSLEDTEDGTLADQAKHWLEKAFGGVEEARSILDHRPGEFRSALLASVRL